MKINIKKFKSNLSFFIISIALIIVISLFSAIFDNKNRMNEEELQNDDVNINSLVINEILASNNGVISDENGNLYDYVEIYNGNRKDINLKGYGLSDENQVKYTFPDVTIESKKYIVIKLTGKSTDEYSASFKLKSSGGETVTIATRGFIYSFNTFGISEKFTGVKSE